MNGFRLIGRIGRKVVMLSFTCALAGLVFVSQASAGNMDAEISEIKLGNFGAFVKMDSDGLTRLKLVCGKQDITEDEDSAFREVTFNEGLANFPAENMETVKINMYTGGANCCQGYYLLVVENHPEGAKHYAAYVEPYDGGLAMNSEPAGYAAIDPSFKGYELEGTGVFLSRAESPRLSRLLVFENGKWRADKPGEFAEYYLDMLAETDEMINPLSKAIALSYYHVMADYPADEAKGLLQNEMPKEFAAKPEIVDRIFADIEEAVKAFDPVENLDI